VISGDGKDIRKVMAAGVGVMVEAGAFEEVRQRGRRREGDKRTDHVPSLKVVRAARGWRSTATCDPCVARSCYDR